MTGRDALRDRLNDLEEQFGIGPTHLVMSMGDGSNLSDADLPDGVDREDIIHRTEEPGIHTDDPIVFEEIVVPHYRPSEYRGGIVIMSAAEIAEVYATMPDDIRKKELEYRIEHGEPIPAVLQE